MGSVRRDAVSPDVLAGSVWQCLSLSPGLAASPAELSGDDATWLPASVPGTAAGALRGLGEWAWGDDDQKRLDGSDWWFRCRFGAPDGSAEGPWRLELDGLATVADVWLNDEHLLHSENMWERHRIEVEQLSTHNVLLLRLGRARATPRPAQAAPTLAQPAAAVPESALVPDNAPWPRPGMGSERGAGGAVATNSPAADRRPSGRRGTHRGGEL